MSYVDSNYWIYWLDSRFPEHSHVLKSMRRHLSRGIIMNYVTLVEVSHHLRRLPEDKFKALVGMIQSLNTLTFVDLNDSITREALDMLPEYAAKGLGGRDCVILATMKSFGVKRILTHDASFKQVKDVEVVDTIPASI